MTFLTQANSASGSRKWNWFASVEMAYESKLTIKHNMFFSKCKSNDKFCILFLKLMMNFGIHFVIILLKFNDGFWNRINKFNDEFWEI